MTKYVANEGGLKKILAHCIREEGSRMSILEEFTWMHSRVFWKPFHAFVRTSVMNAMELYVDGWRVHEWTHEGRNGLQSVVLNCRLVYCHELKLGKDFRFSKLCVSQSREGSKFVENT